MKKDLLDILACPICKTSLQLEIDVETGFDVVKGTLKCIKCGEVYSIENSIPNLIPSEPQG